MRKVITITGPSGSGKDSIVDGLLFLAGLKSSDDLSPFVRSKIPELYKLQLPMEFHARDREIPYMRELISHTTRAPRAGEIDGKDYYFVSLEKFLTIPKVENVVYAGNRYGLSEAELKDPAEIGIVIVDIEGKEAVENYMGEENTESIFLKVPPNVIETRMTLRGDAPETIAKRLANAEETHEFDNGIYCKHIIENDDYVTAIEAAITIIKNI